MKFSAGSSGDFKLVAAGTHVAVCNMVVDIGMQETGFGTKHQIYIRWELPNERLEYEKDGVQKEGPMSIGRFFTASMNEKATLRVTIESWFSKKFPNDQIAEDFDVAKLVGRACQLSVVHSEKNGKTHANISAVTSLPKGVIAPKAENPLIVYGVGHEGSLKQLPEWIVKKLGAMVDEDASIESAAAQQADNLEDIPW